MTDKHADDGTPSGDFEPQEYGVDDFDILETDDVTALTDDDLEVLRNLVAKTLVGGDQALLDSLTGEGEIDPDFLGPEDLEDGGPLDPHEVALAEAQAAVEGERRAQEVYKILLGRAPEHDFDPKLDRVRSLLDILGNPQDAYPSIHVAGTNGKSSVTRMAAALTAEMGLRTGSFTSPHLVDVKERIAINGEPLSAEQFVFAWEDIEPYVAMVDEAAKRSGGPRLSYFELLTVIAMAAFADAPVDMAVFETGMGGRWDATNVLDSGVSVITPIAVDHQKWLGSTIEEIASEKAGIIKPKSVVVSSRQHPDALAVIEEKCAETDSILWLEGRDFKVLGRQSGVGGQMVDIQTPAGVYEDIFLPLHGKHQAHNAAAALVAVEAMLGGKALHEDVVDAGFGVVRAPGRLEVVRRSPTIVVDGAHNPAGVKVLREGLEEAFRFNVTVGVFSAMEDKNIEAMLVEIEPDLDSIILVELAGDRAADMETMSEIAVDVFGDDRVVEAADLTDAIDKAVEAADLPQDQTLTRGIVVFGSLYLVGEAVALLQN